jgi:hypothetical protein
MVVPHAVGSAIVAGTGRPFGAAAYGWLAHLIFEAGQQCLLAEKMPRCSAI